MAHADKCILSGACKLAGSPSCNRLCSAFIGMHGASGKGGRQGSANIPKDYRYLTLVNTPVRAEQPAAYKVIDAYVSTFVREVEPSDERIKSLYLFSEEPGTGKTTTAACIANEYLIRTYIASLQRGITPHPKPVLFLDCNAWQTDYNMFNRSNIPKDIAEPASQRYYKTMQAAQTVPLLIADDIGVRSASEAFRSDVHALVNERVTNKLPTIYTSNIPIDKLDSKFDRRLADRIRDMTFVVNFTGESRRGMRR